MKPIAVCGVTEGMTKDKMVESFKSAPKGSRHERMLWAAWKIAHLTGNTEGGAYRMLLIALIDADESSRGSMAADD
jgi:hypothetical protein